MFFGFGVMPFGNVWLIESFGWRAAWQAWAAALERRNLWVFFPVVV